MPVTLTLKYKGNIIDIKVSEPENGTTSKYIKTMWKYRYGKMYFSEDVEVEETIIGRKSRYLNKQKGKI